MVRIPNAERAFIDIRKLQDYALNAEHRVGKHKALLFATRLGINSDNAEELRALLLQAVKDHDADIHDRDEYGQRYCVDFILEWKGREASLRSVWNIRPAEDFPRLVTCYPIQEVD